MSNQNQTAAVAQDEASVNKPTFVKFPNGKVWLMGVNNNISGVVACHGFENAGDLEARMDLTAEAVTGSTAGLVDFSYRHVGSDMVFFNGYVNGELFVVDGGDDEAEDGLEMVETISGDALFQALSEQYQIGLGEAKHAVASIETNYGMECVLSIAGSNRAIHTPAHPAECDYVRIVVAGDLEIAYWNSEEWKDPLSDVMGAIMGAANGGA